MPGTKGARLERSVDAADNSVDTTADASFARIVVERQIAVAR